MRSLVVVAGFFGWKSFSGGSLAPRGADVADRATERATNDLARRSQQSGAPSDRVSDSSPSDGEADADAHTGESAGAGAPGEADSEANGSSASRSGVESAIPSGSTTPNQDLGSQDAPQTQASQQQTEASTQTQPAATQPKGPTEVELARAIESAIDRQDWDGADRQLALLQTTHPGAGTDAFERRIEEGRRAAVAESRIPTLIESGDLALAETELQAYESIRPDDARAARWRAQIAEMKAVREGPARERKEIGALVMEFHDAFSNLDLDRFAALFVDPGATRNEYERAFRDLASQTITILAEPNIDLRENTATVHLRDRRRQVMKIGRTFESEFDVVLQLEKVRDRWKIRAAQTKLLQ